MFSSWQCRFILNFSKSKSCPSQLSSKYASNALLPNALNSWSLFSRRTVFVFPAPCSLATGLFCVDFGCCRFYQYIRCREKNIATKDRFTLIVLEGKTVSGSSCPEIDPDSTYDCHQTTILQDPRQLHEVNGRTLILQQVSVAASRGFRLRCAVKRRCRIVARQLLVR